MSDTDFDLIDFAIDMRRVWDDFLEPERRRLRRSAQEGGFTPNEVPKVSIESQLRTLEDFETHLLALEREAVRLPELDALVK